MTRAVKYYSPGEIMTDCCLHANDLKLRFGFYCQVADHVEPRNSLAPRTSAATSLGNSGNLLGGQMLLVSYTGHTTSGLCSLCHLLLLLGCTLLFVLLLRLGPRLRSNISITRNTE
jgi:hypothetical protein